MKKDGANFPSGGGTSEVLGTLGVQVPPVCPGLALARLLPLGLQDKDGFPKAFMQNNWYLLLRGQRIPPATPFSFLFPPLSPVEGRSPQRAGKVIRFQETGAAPVVGCPWGVGGFSGGLEGPGHSPGSSPTSSGGLSSLEMWRKDA